VPRPEDDLSHVRWLDDAPQLERPILIAAFEGWNDAGDAATTAARHLADRWDATALAELDAEEFYDFSVTRPLVQLDEDRNRSLLWPTNLVRAARVPGSDHDVLVLLGLEPQLRWPTFAAQVVGLARRFDAARVITLGALLADVPHTRPVEVYGATEDGALMAELDLAPSTYEGPTGIVGVLAAACRDAGIPTASFWSAVPSYVPGAASPKAALALVHRVCEVVGANVYLTDLEIAAAAYERQVDELLADDHETAGYVADLEEAWDASEAVEIVDDDDVDAELADDPDTLVAEVEEFLRDND